MPMSTVAEQSNVFVAVGRRKTSTARVRLTRGSTPSTINGKPFEAFFPTEQALNLAKSPLVSAELEGQVSLLVRVQGGGVVGQAGAVRLGIARALEKMQPDLRPTLKKDGHMRRDPRAKERKKSGQPGARKRFQFSKR